MNLSTTARSALRAREIGIRKVIGARRKELIAQFAWGIGTDLLGSHCACGRAYLSCHSLAEQGFRPGTFDFYSSSLENPYTAFADTFCRWNSFGLIPCPVYVLLSTGKNIERSIQNRRQQYLFSVKCWWWRSFPSALS